MKRALALGVIALLIFSAAIYLVDSNFRARAIADARRDLAARAQLLAVVLDHTLQARMTETLGLAALPSLRGFVASDDLTRAQRAALAQSELQALVAADPNVRAMSIVDGIGQVILTTDGSMGATWSERIFVREALAGHLHASVPARDFREISQYYGAPIIDNAGNVAGALVVRVAVQEFWDVLSSQTNVLVVDDNGVRIADRSKAPQVFVAVTPLSSDAALSMLVERRYGAETNQIRATNLPALGDQIKRRTDATFAYRDTNGRTVHAATRHLAINPWSVIVFETEDAIAAPARDADWEAIKLSLATLVAAGFVFISAYLPQRTTEKAD